MKPTILTGTRHRPLPGLQRLPSLLNPPILAVFSRSFVIPLAHSELSTFTESQHHTTSYLAIHNQRQGGRKPVYQHGNLHKPPIITPISCPRYLHRGTLQAQVNVTRNISVNSRRMKHWKGHGHHRNDRRLGHARAHSGTVSQSLHNGLCKNLSSICTTTS